VFNQFGDLERCALRAGNQARTWTKPRRVIAKVEWHPGELYPRVGFIVTNMSRPAERVVAFYNKRGTCERWIKEGKGARARMNLRMAGPLAIRSSRFPSSDSPLARKLGPKQTRPTAAGRAMRIVVFGTLAQGRGWSRGPCVIAQRRAP
jgi:hypothetical protein